MYKFDQQYIKFEDLNQNSKRRIYRKVEIAAEFASLATCRWQFSGNLA